MIQVMDKEIRHTYDLGADDIREALYDYIRGRSVDEVVLDELLISFNNGDSAFPSVTVTMIS